MTPLEPALVELAARLAAAVGLPGPPPAYGPPAPAPPPRVDWTRWLELAREHDVAPLLAARPGGAPLPAYVHDALRADHARWAHQTLFRAAELRAVLDALAPLGDVVVLKGAAVAATDYAEAAERVTSDLDLLVRGRDARRAAIGLLTGRGYHPRGVADDDRHDLALASTVAELEIDLHVDLARPALPAGALDDAWARRVRIPALGGIVVLDPVWRAIHAAVHALADPIGSPVLRNLLEAGWLAARLDGEGRAALVDRARRFGIAPRVATALALAHRLFGSPALLGEPRPGARAWWAWRRLGWRYGEAAGIDRTIEHVAEYHLRRLDDGDRHELDPRPLAATLADVTAGWIAGAARAARRRVRPGPLARAPAATHPVGDDLLVHALDTDDVHLVTGDAIAAWHAAATPGTRAALERRVVARGVAVASAAEAVEALIECGLLVPYQSIAASAARSRNV